MLSMEEDLAIQRVVRESVLENARMNILCMEGLITNAAKAANLKRDRCALVTQQVNYEVVEMSMAEENVHNRFTEDEHELSFQPISFSTDAPSYRQPDAPVFEPIQPAPVKTHHEWPSRGAATRTRRYF
jgi:hypothetical protein